MTALRITDIESRAGSPDFDCGAALDDVAAELDAGNEMCLPAGKYPTSRQCTFTSRWLGQTERPWLFGEGGATSWIVPTFQDKPWAILDGAHLRMGFRDFGVRHSPGGAAIDLEPAFTGLTDDRGHAFFADGLTLIENTRFENMELWTAGAGIFLQNAFNITVKGVKVNPKNHDGILLQGGPATLLEGCYAGLIGTGCCGYRIADMGEMISCNAADDGDFGAIFGMMVPIIAPTITAVTSTTMTCSGMGMNTDQLAGNIIEVTAGTGAGQKKRIVANTSGGQMAIKSAWSPNPATGGGSTVRIYNPLSRLDSGGPFHKVAQIAMRSCNLEYMQKYHVKTDFESGLILDNWRSYASRDYEARLRLCGGPGARTTIIGGGGAVSGANVGQWTTAGGVSRNQPNNIMVDDQNGSASIYGINAPQNTYRNFGAGSDSTFVNVVGT